MKLFGLGFKKKATAGEKQRAYAVAKAELVEPTEECIRFAKAAVAQIPDSRLATNAAEQKEVISHILENPQDDLQYFKAVYATCGFNLNDDVFIREEFWKARKSPVLKPANWQHKDTDILGVVYAVEAQTLDGAPLDIESEKVPEQDFELIVHGVVYKYTFAERAKEIENRSKANELYVSMETWFSNFAYALLNEDDETIDVVDRTEGTEALDRELRCFGGPGRYNGKRIGRVLKGLTFGGMGFVDQPANPRSDGLVFANTNTNRVEEIPHTNQQMEIDMHDETKVREAVAAELNERAKADKLVQLESKVETLEAEKAEAAENAERAAQKAKEDELALALIGEKLDEAIAGLGDNAPAEIAKIDNAGVGGEFAAKIAFLAATAAKTNDEAVQAELDELRQFKADTEAAQAEAEKAARAEARKAEVQELLGEDADEESVDKILAGLAELDEEAYASRIEELKIVAGSRPGLMKDGGQGSAEEEGKSGESHAKSGPRHKISVAESLENAEVEETIEPTGGDEVNDSPFQGLAGAIGLGKENKE